jgi:hypothetical protein
MGDCAVLRAQDEAEKYFDMLVRDLALAGAGYALSAAGGNS